jgi:hypothetical protein
MFIGTGYVKNAPVPFKLAGMKGYGCIRNGYTDSDRSAQFRAAHVRRAVTFYKPSAPLKAR